MQAPVELETRQILGMRVDATTYDDAVSRVVNWAKRHESRYVSVATVNNVMRAHDDEEFGRIMRESDLVTPDGMPLVWGLQRLGIRSATRVYGPDLTPSILAAAAATAIPVAFYGSAPDVLHRLEANVRRQYPKIQIAYRHSPPFRPPTEEEHAQTVREINASGARVVFVGLSTPKQERWMAAQRGRVNAVMVGVGAAFDFLAGSKPQAPRWMRQIGMEWFFRLVTEPRRLWRRYLADNPRFVLLFALQLCGLRDYSARRAGV